MRNAWVSARKHELRNLLRRRCNIEIVKLGSADPRDAETLLPLRLDQLFGALDVQLVLDVGARFGVYVWMLRRNGYKGPVVSFEPIASNYAELSRAAKKDDRWQTVNVALGSEDGEAAINVNKRTTFSSFFTPNAFAREEFGDGVGSDHVEVVEVRRLDTVLPQILGTSTLPPTFLKMDTQGWDLEVVRGATSVLSDIVALQSEVSVMPIYEGMPGIHEAFDIFNELGFALSGVFPVGYDQRQRIMELDCVFIADSRQ
jgi:FkbM family methyltransferase